jgi:hypothetical protein
VDDVKDADYVVLSCRESQLFNVTWGEAQEYSKPTVTPKFIFESYEKGTLLDPRNYPVSGPEKPRRNGSKNVRPRPATTTQRRMSRERGGSAEGVSSPSGSLEELLDWQEFFKYAEYMESRQYIRAMLKRNSQLTYEDLAIRLYKKVSLPEPVPHASLTLGANPYLPTGYMVSSLWVLKQFAHPDTHRVLCWVLLKRTHQRTQRVLHWVLLKRTHQRTRWVSHWVHCERNP